MNYKYLFAIALSGTVFNMHGITEPLGPQGQNQWPAVNYLEVGTCAGCISFLSFVVYKLYTRSKLKVLACYNDKTNMEEMFAFLNMGFFSRDDCYIVRGNKNTKDVIEDFCNGDNVRCGIFNHSGGFRVVIASQNNTAKIKKDN